MKKIAWIVGMALIVDLALAHTGSPSMHTFVDGNALTALQLNNSYGHLHNTFNAGIVDAHCSTSMGLQHAKLAEPPLLPKAFAVVGSTSAGTVCNGAAAVNTACTLADSLKVTAVKANATAGQYCVDLAFSPADASFLVLVNSHTSGVYCHAITNYTAGAGTTTGAGCTNSNFVVVCLDAPTAAAATNAVFSLTVMDT